MPSQGGMRPLLCFCFFKMPWLVLTMVVEYDVCTLVGQHVKLLSRLAFWRDNLACFDDGMSGQRFPNDVLLDVRLRFESGGDF